MTPQLRNAVILFVTITTSSIGSMASAQPVIDGIFSPGEWTNATAYPLAINLPEGGTTPGHLYIWNDLTDLYVALRYERTTIDLGTEASLVFDWQGTGTLSEGSDSIGVLQYGFCPQPEFYDGFITLAVPPCAPIPGAVCNTNDTAWKGSQDGAGTLQRDGIWLTYEMRHPLNSGDFRDMAVTRRMTMPFSLYVNLSNMAIVGASTSLYDKYRMH